MKKLRPTIFFIFVSTQLFGQELDSNSFFQTNHFSIGLENGMSFTTFERLNGEHTLLQRPSYSHAFHFKNTFNFSEFWGLNASAELGFQAFNFGVASNGIYEGTENWKYGWTSWYGVYAKLALGGQFHKTLSDKTYFFTDLNFGWSIFNQSGYSSSSSNQTTGTTLFHIKANRNSNVNPFVNLQTGYKWQLKNKDFIGFSIFGKIQFKNYLTGTYEIYDNTSSGNLSSKGSNFGIGLHYVFSQIRKREFLDDLKLSDLDEKGKKRFVKKEKRFVHPKSIFIGIRGGIFSASTIYPKSSPIKTAGNPSWISGINAEFGLKHHVYVTGAISAQQFWESVSFKSNGGSFSSSFVSTGFSVGISKHMYSRKRNSNIFNCEVGFSTAFHFGQLGTSGTGSGSAWTTNGPSSQYESVSTTNGRFYGTIYGGINRDFQLSKNLFFNLSYRYDLGLRTVTTIDIDYWNDPNNATPQEFQGKINGTSHSTQIGLRYKFLK